MINFEETMNLDAPASVLAAMDKFRGTASARDLSDAVARVANSHNISCDVQPMSDGGEGFRDAFVGEVVVVTVPGLFDNAVEVPMTLCDTALGRLAVLEVAEVVGRPHLVVPSEQEALEASSDGVGHLILSAADLGVERILIGAGGSATSDAGLGCYRVLKDAGGLPVPVTVATDVTATFAGLRRYAEQKGVNPRDLRIVDERIELARSLYLREMGVDVSLVERTGASGGIPGALVALGAALTSGLDAVAGSVGLVERIARSSLVVSGEGRFDEGSLEGKVVAGLASMMVDDLTLLVVCGSADRDAARQFVTNFPNAEVISLAERFGEKRSMEDALQCVENVVTEVIDWSSAEAGSPLTLRGRD
jgi:glycerate kinase